MINITGRNRRFEGYWGACAVLEIAVNGVFVTIGDDEEDDYE